MKKLYWRMYQSKEDIEFNSVVLTEDEMKKEIEAFFKYRYDDNELAPVFEPEMFTEEEFNALPEFKGF